MSFKSILDKLGSDAKGILSFLGSSKGQALISTGESIVVAVEPGAAGLVSVFNNWFTEILKTQALATAAGAQTGSNEQKAAVTIAAIGPQLVQFAQAEGMPVPTATQVNSINTLLVQALNILGSTPAA